MSLHHLPHFDNFSKTCVFFWTSDTNYFQNKSTSEYLVKKKVTFQDSTFFIVLLQDNNTTTLRWHASILRRSWRLQTKYASTLQSKTSTNKSNTNNNKERFREHRAAASMRAAIFFFTLISCFNESSSKMSLSG